jgi:hypothetical protein
MANPSQVPGGTVKRLYPILAHTMFCPVKQLRNEPDGRTACCRQHLQSL